MLPVFQIYFRSFLVVQNEKRGTGEQGEPLISPLRKEPLSEAHGWCVPQETLKFWAYSSVG
jgi:hypothetical protein